MYTIDNVMYTGLESLFPAKARIKILTLFLLNPDDRYYLREICRAAALPLQAAQRELRNLVQLGFLDKQAEGNRIFYTAKTDFFLYPELQSIILKTTGLGDILREGLRNKKEIEVAFIYGSYAKNTQNTQSDIDLFVIGEITSRKLHAVISQIQKDTKREIRFVNYSSREFRKKARDKDHFVTSVLKGPRIFIAGDEDALQEIS